jgi:hypothetical protein
MKQFIQRFGSRLRGCLSGFDRIRCRGTLRILAHVKGMMYYLSHEKVRLTEFGKFVESKSQEIREAVNAQAHRHGLAIEYVASAATSKEAKVQEILEKRGKDVGLVCILSCVEPCRSYEIVRDRERKMIDLVSRQRKCLHYYHYFIDPKFGLVHVRTQTWFPFTVHIVLNGREWLSRQLDAAKIGYLRSDNCFLQLDDLRAAQRLMNRQVEIKWSYHLNRLMRQANPAFNRMFRNFPLEPYWSMDETEWATDLMFTSADDLQELYPRLILHSIKTFGSQNVMRFLGHKTAATPGSYGRFDREVITDLRRRQEGVRIKHWVDRNSLKMYDKYGQVLRIETTINDPGTMKTYRPKEGDPDGPMQWRKLRKGVADTKRRAEISQNANQRYLAALAHVEQEQPLGELLQQLCCRKRWQGKSVRALNPFADEDGALLSTVSRAEFLINGFRNRDLRSLLFGADDSDPTVRKRQSSVITRKLRLLRAHGLIKKLSKTHRYQLSEKGRATITAIQAAKGARVSALTQAA